MKLKGASEEERSAGRGDLNKTGFFQQHPTPPREVKAARFSPPLIFGQHPIPKPSQSPSLGVCFRKMVLGSQRCKRRASGWCEVQSSGGNVTLQKAGRGVQNSNPTSALLPFW